jgi:hypothetical protein
MQLESRFIRHCFITVVFCHTITLPIWSQISNNRTLFEARIIDQTTGLPVVFANVINPARNWWMVTDTTGRVRMPVYPGDTLTISSLGYILIHYTITDAILNLPKPVTIRLQEKKYEIARVTIQALGTYEDFKYRILHLKMPDKLIGLKFHLKLDKDKLPAHPLQEQMAIPLFSPITALYNIFSKEGKSKRKLVDAYKNEELIRYANLKYNRDLVERITGLKDVKLDEFILRYRPSVDYLISTTEYDVIGRIIQDFEYYKIEQDTLPKK